MIRVMLVEDHVHMALVLRNVVSAEPDFEVVGEAADGTTAVERARRIRPDIILMDIDLPEMSGIAATRAIRAWLPDARVLMLTVSAAECDLFESLNAGAVGYVTKDARRSDIVAAIRGAHHGAMPLTPGMATHVLQYFRVRPPAPSGQRLATLSPREREILGLLSRGLRDKEIGLELDISIATVRKHVEHILAKLQARTRAEASAILYLDHRGDSSEPI